MSKSYRKQLNDIRTEIGNIATTFSSELSKQAHEDLIEAHHQIIDNFYAAHDPSSYNRYGELYNSIIPQGTNHVGVNTYQTSVVVGSFRMDDHYNGDTTPDNIFDLMWNKGVRGLPRVGSTPLDHSYSFYNNHFEEGQKWVNPYWSGQNEPYHNIFLTKISMGGYTTNKECTPHQAMSDFVKNWDKASGNETCKKVYKEIKNKYK